VDGDIEPKKLHESLVFTKAKECGKIMRVVFMRVDGGELAIAEDIAINPTCNIGKLGDAEIKRVNGRTRWV